MWPFDRKRKRMEAAAREKSDREWRAAREDWEDDLLLKGWRLWGPSILAVPEDAPIELLRAEWEEPVLAMPRTIVPEMNIAGLWWRRAPPMSLSGINSKGMKDQ